MKDAEYKDQELLDEVVNSCLDRWNSDDKRTRYFCDHFKEWLKQMPEELKPIALDY